MICNNRVEKDISILLCEKYCLPSNKIPDCLVEIHL
ncbi:hypothetical protein GAB14E_3461 [Colwellia psychrerythraea]|uniref:Uncharacterized protein n=1 Tax=Colwellia psychrerythraea TaxID=28229 RepID=A0A099KK92_COLPS|nr:hypothetical protein GAB14E_3461 [Colwellia psychrerythraea]